MDVKWTVCVDICHMNLVLINACYLIAFSVKNAAVQQLKEVSSAQLLAAAYSLNSK